MNITAALSVDLALLTQALDRPGTDIVNTLHQVAADARLTVRSYMGLTLTTGGDAPFTFTVLEDHARSEDVRSSLLVPLPHAGTGNVAAGAALLLYGARARTFVDLSADLSWLTGVELSHYALDQHLPTGALPSSEAMVHDTSVINQAIGVLIGRGHLPDNAHEQLTAEAADAGTDRYAAAVHILRTLATDAEPTHDPRW